MHMLNLKLICSFFCLSFSFLLQGLDIEIQEYPSPTYTKTSIMDRCVDFKSRAIEQICTPVFIAGTVGASVLGAGIYMIWDAAVNKSIETKTYQGTCSRQVKNSYNNGYHTEYYKCTKTGCKNGGCYEFGFGILFVAVPVIALCYLFAVANFETPRRIHRYASTRFGR